MTGPSASPRVEPEFGPAENALFSELSSGMGLVGLFFTVMGLLAIVMGVLTLMTRDAGPGALSVLVSGVVFVAIGVLTRDAGREFRAIARTDGSDRTHLMSALADLRKLYNLLYWVAIAVVGIFLVLLVYALVNVPGRPLA